MVNLLKTVNKTVAKLFAKNVKKCFLPNLKPASYLNYKY